MGHSSSDEEEEKDEFELQKAAHRAAYQNAEADNLPDEINDEDVTNALKKIRYAFAMLDAEHFSLYKDLHMKTKITAFKRREIDFVDMGTCLTNSEKNEKYYFIKMVHASNDSRLRQVYILAFSESQVHKWDNSLRL